MKVGGLVPLQKLARLRVDMAEAVKKEKYETAARLRDRIKDLEQKLRDSARISKISQEE